MANIDVFTNKYRTTLTVKNELKPIGATLDYIKKHGFIVEDEKRNEDYKKAKVLIDAFHQKFINYVLNDVKELSWQELQDTTIALQKAQKNKMGVNEKDFASCKKAYNDVCKKTRKSIHNLFNKTDSVFSLKKIFEGNTDERFISPDSDVEFNYKDLFGKNLITSILPAVLSGENLDVIPKLYDKV